MSGGEVFVMLMTAVAGAVVASVLSLVPALHIYNVAGLILLATTGLGGLVPPDRLAMLFLGMVTGYAMLNVVPSVFLCAPDDSTIFVVLPARKFLLQRRGHEAAVLTGVGGLGGIAVLALLTPVAPALLPAVRAILRPHLHWILWTIVAYLLLSEWPKGFGRAPSGWRRWWEGWKSLTAGLATFLLSGFLGFILLHRSLVPVEVAYQNLLPAFVGLFAVPWIVQNLLSRVELPEQHIARTLDATPGMIAQGTVAGALGGLFAAFFPVVTGGVGGLLAGHATAQRDDRLFLIAQGASKVVYYAGGLLLFFVPGLHLTRGGMAWMLSTVWTGRGPQTYYVAVAAVVLSGVLSFFLLLFAARLTIQLIGAVHYRWISVGTLFVLLAVVVGFAGWGGLLICAVATGVGLIPALWGSRRTLCMGVLLLPIALNMSGLGNTVARWMGLM
ncbi:MAG: tripartite tricarboxylate transporter permease [Anaerolineae bacterium]|jgi:putative membrane protein